MVTHRSSRAGGVTFDWTVPVWGVVVLAIQGLAIIWWGATLTSRVQTLEASAAANLGTPATLARLDERGKAVDATLSRIEGQLDHINARMDGERHP